MFLGSMKADSFRNLSAADFQFDPGFNIFFGNNGQGKTNLLEAIYILANTKSFRTHHLSECVRYQKDRFWIHGSVQKKSLERLLLLEWQAGNRELRVNEKTESILGYLGNLDALVISFDQLPIVRGAPEQRRKFLDRGIAQLKKAYLYSLAEFHQVLQQRNHLLVQIREGSAPVSDLEVWEPIYADRALFVSAERERYVEELNRTLHQVRFSSDALLLRYLRSTRERDPTAFCEALASLRSKEIHRGRSLKGPHRDDLEILIDERPIQSFGSGGQQRSAVFSLLLAATHLYFIENKEYPVLLIDDVDAELDIGRLQGLLDRLRGQRQVFLSTAKENVLRSIDYGKKWEVLAGSSLLLS